MPVVVLSDKETAMTIESVDLAALPPALVEPRAAAPDGAAFVPYRIEGEEDVPAFAPVGGAHKVTATGSAHNERGQLRKNDPETLRQLRHLRSKVEARAAAMELVRHRPAKGAKVLLVSYGVSARTCRQVVREMKNVALLEVLSLFPVPHRALRVALDGIERVVIVEENEPGLYARELRPHLDGVEVRQVNDVGAMITPDAIRQAVVA
jgi:2-oxoglutarate ferredoxin oxidoreductase subunit alpha